MALRHRRTNMDVPISIGVLLARPSFDGLGLALSPAWLLWAATAGGSWRRIPTST